MSTTLALLAWAGQLYGIWWGWCHVQGRRASRRTMRRLEAAQARERALARLERDVLDGESVDDMVARIEAGPSTASHQDASAYVTAMQAARHTQARRTTYRMERVEIEGPDGEVTVAHVPTERQPGKGSPRLEALRVLERAGYDVDRMRGWDTRLLEREAAKVKPAR